MAAPITPGTKMPDCPVAVVTADGFEPKKTGELFPEGKRVALFSVPGAFTPTCTEAHLPGFVERAAEIKEKGKIDEVYCMAVNDPFVLKAWGEHKKAFPNIKFIADGSGCLTKELGLSLDLTDKGLGVRGQRFAMLVKDGKVERLDVDPEKLDKSSATSMLANLQ